MTPELKEDVRVLNAVRSRKRARIYIKRARYAPRVDENGVLRDPLDEPT